MKPAIHTLEGWKLAQHIERAELAASEVYLAFKERIASLDAAFNSFVSVFEPPALPEGTSPLKGAPIAVKDNICIKGKVTSCASRILNTHTAVYDATVINRLKRAGLAIIGTTNMDEFAFGSSTENSCYGPTKNPWDTSRVPGGSSGGSAAAVAARLVPFALGSDTGGSKRQPASFCGVVGFKPTYGRVSRYGLIAFGSSLDQIGPITTNFTDAAHLLNIMCGFDEHDSTSAKEEVPDFTKALSGDIKGLRIGIPKEYFGEGLDAEVRDALDATMWVFKKAGAKTLSVSLPHTRYAVSTYYIVAPSEASSNLQRFDGIKYGLRVADANLIRQYKKTRNKGFGDEAKRRILIGTYCLSSGYYDAYYVRALKVRTLIKKDFEDAFNEVDVLLTPTAPTPPFKIGDKAKDPLSMYLSDMYTISANLAGTCAVSFPCGFTKGGLPIGAQLIGKPFAESTLLRTGFTFEQKTEYHTKIPHLASS